MIMTSTESTAQTAAGTEDIRTDHERRRDEQWAAVRDRYKALRRANPSAKPSRLFAVIAREKEMTLHGVRHICIRGGLYTPTPKKAAPAGEDRL